MGVHKFSLEALAYMQMEGLSKLYGWTPNQIRKIRLRDLRAYLALQSEGSTTNHQLRGLLHGRT